MLLDSTMANSFATCPAKFHQRHRKHWSTIQTKASIAAAFGTAWHAAMDVVWERLCKPIGATGNAVRYAAMDAFRAAWDEAGLPRTQGILQDDALELHKERYWPDIAFDMLYEYIETHRQSLAKWTLLGREVPFIVPLSTEIDLHYCGLIDKVIQTDSNHIVPVDHKTTSAFALQGGFQFDWQESFVFSGQLIGYAYNLMLQNQKQVSYAYIDASLTHKTHHAIHKMLPISITKPNIEAWLRTVQGIGKRIMELDALGDGEEWQKLGILSGACSGINGRFGCPFRNNCQSGYQLESPNPPPGFEIKPWEPVRELQPKEE